MSHPENQQWNNDGQQGQQYNAQGGQSIGQGYGQNQQQWSGQPGQPAQGGQPWQQQAAGGSGDGVGAVFSDMKFGRSLTQSIAGPVFMAVTVATVLWALFDIIYGFMGDKMGDSDSALKMAIFPAILNLLADLVIACAVILATRVLLELAVNVERIAKRGN